MSKIVLDKSPGHSSDRVLSVVGVRDGEDADDLVAVLLHFLVDFSCELHQEKWFLKI